MAEISTPILGEGVEADERKKVQHGVNGEKNEDNTFRTGQDGKEQKSKTTEEEKIGIFKCWWEKEKKKGT